jgi:hypothetical protein
VSFRPSYHCLRPLQHPPTSLTYPTLPREKEYRKKQEEETNHNPSPSVNEDKITDNETAKSWITSYLNIGEIVMDQSVAVMSSIAWFERKR